MESVLELREVTKSYWRGAHEVRALRGVSFTIDRPQVVALVGPSGSGKSTLLNAIARFDQIDKGSITVAGIDVHEVSEADLDRFRNKTLGFVFQQFNLLPVLTAAENVELALLPRSLPRRERRGRAEAILRTVGLGERLAHFPSQLSGGQQQRVALARALVGGPAVVIADEPTGNLDAATTHDVLSLIRELKQELGTTFLVATHDPRVMDMADRVLTLVDGETNDSMAAARNT